MIKLLNINVYIMEKPIIICIPNNSMILLLVLVFGIENMFKNEFYLFYFA